MSGTIRCPGQPLQPFHEPKEFTMHALTQAAQSKIDELYKGDGCVVTSVELDMSGKLPGSVNTTNQVVCTNQHVDVNKKEFVIAANNASTLFSCAP